MFKNILLLVLVVLLGNIQDVKLQNDQDTSKNETNSRDKNICDYNICKLPLCKCADTLAPGDLELNEIPMMIMLTFNGIIKKEYSDYFKKILNPIFKNPNGCPVQGTFYVSDSSNAKTDYCLVQKLFNNNNEIGVSATKYNCPYTDCKSAPRFHPWTDEEADASVYEQKRNIARKGRINRSFLRGFRLPYLDSKGNIHYQALRKYAFNYESSVIIRQEDMKKHNGLRLWPHTLDYPLPYRCDSCPEYKKLCENKNCSMESFWIVPLHFLNYESKNPCPTLLPIDKFDDQLPTKNCIQIDEITEKILEKILHDNFQRHYQTNKAPFVLNIETSWFNKYGDKLSTALVNFVSNITSKNNNKTNDDVYFVTIAKALDWIQYPVPLEIIANKWLWDCDGVDFDYDQECDFVEQLVKNAEVLEQIKANKSKIEIDLRAEDLYRNGVLSSVIIIFIISVIFVVLYDRYY